MRNLLIIIIIAIVNSSASIALGKPTSSDHLASQLKMRLQSANNQQYNPLIPGYTGDDFSSHRSILQTSLAIA